MQINIQACLTDVRMWVYLLRICFVFAAKRAHLPPIWQVSVMAKVAIDTDLACGPTDVEVLVIHMPAIAYIAHAADGSEALTIF